MFTFTSFICCKIQLRRALAAAALLLGTLGPHGAIAQEIGPHLQTPMIDTALLIKAIDLSDPDNASSVTRFDSITTDFYEVDTNGNPVTDPMTSNQIKDPGGQMLITYLVRALNAPLTDTPLPVWIGPNPLTVSTNFPTPLERTIAKDIVTLAQSGDEDEIKKLHAIMSDYVFFEWTGKAPDATYLNTIPNPPVTVVGKSGQNVGAEALAFLAGGRGKHALTTIALALENDANARKVMSTIFTYFPTCNKKPPFINEPQRHPQLPPPSPTCVFDTSDLLYDALENSLSVIAGADPSGAMNNKSAAEIMRAAFAPTPNTYALNALSLVLSQFLQGYSHYPPPRGQIYIGPTAIEFLRSALSVLPPPIISQRPEIEEPAPISSSPVLGGGLHNIPSTGENKAPPPCTWKEGDVRLQKRLHPSPSFGTDPCAYTRDTLKLDFAQKFKAGEQFSAYLRKWTQEQWIPALKRMTAQWSAAMIDQTRMIGSAIDASLAVKAAAKIQNQELAIKKALAPTELACVAASALPGLSYAKSVVHALSDALDDNMDLELATGKITGNGLAP